MRPAGFITNRYQLGLPTGNEYIANRLPADTGNTVPPTVITPISCFDNGESVRIVAAGKLRVIAHLIDLGVHSTIQAIVLLIVAGPKLSERASLLVDNDPPPAQVWALDTVTDLWPQLLTSIIVAWLIGGVYKTVATRLLGGTLGKLIVSIEVVNVASGLRCSWKQAANRWLGVGWATPVGLIAAPVHLLPTLGYLLAWRDPWRRTLHDRWAGTIVVQRHLTIKKDDPCGH